MFHYQIHVDIDMFMLKALTFYIQADNLEAANERVKIALKELGVIEFEAELQYTTEDEN